MSEDLEARQVDAQCLINPASLLMQEVRGKNGSQGKGDWVTSREILIPSFYWTDKKQGPERRRLMVKVTQSEAELELKFSSSSLTHASLLIPSHRMEGMDQVGGGHVGEWVERPGRVHGNPSWGPLWAVCSGDSFNPYLKFICILKCSDGNMYLHYTLQ